MTSIDSLRSLQDRIRNSSGADREIDGEIAVAFGGWQKTELNVTNINGATEATDVWHPKSWSAEDWWHENGYRLEMGDGDNALPRFTASLDACVGLLEAALPSATWCKSMLGKFCVEVGTRSHISERLATDCLTFIDAILSALIAQLETSEAVG